MGKFVRDFDFKDAEERGKIMGTLLKPISKEIARKRYKEDKEFYVSNEDNTYYKSSKSVLLLNKVATFEEIVKMLNNEIYDGLQKKLLYYV